MKKSLLAMVLALALLFAACGSTQTVLSESAQVINPMSGVDDVDAINKSLGVNMTVPESAEEPAYFLVNKMLGEIQWRWRGVEYEYRAAISTANISGLEYDVLSTDSFSVTSAAGKTTTVTLNEIETGWYAVWFWDDAQYCLYGATTYEQDTRDVSLQLAQASAPQA